MPRPLRAPPPSGVFYPPSLFGRLALQRPRWSFAHVAQSMQMDPYRFDPSGVAGDALQIGGQQPSRPYRAGHVDTAWVQVDHPSQLRQPGRRDLQRSSWCFARSQACQALGLKAMQHFAHLMRPTADKPGDLWCVAAFVGQQHDLAIGPLHRSTCVLVAIGHRGASRLVQPQPYRRCHQQHSPGSYRAGTALYRKSCQRDRPIRKHLVGAASQLDLLIAGNHDAWALGPDRVVARGRDVFRLSSRALASRHGIDCWHGSPRHALLGFLTEASAAKVLPDRPVGSLGLVGHTHEPVLFAYDGAATRAVRPVPGKSYDWLPTGACMANPGAVCGNPRDGASWWLIVDIDT